MTVRGHVRRGVVVIDPPALLPEGAEVEVSIVAADHGSGGSGEDLSNKLLKWAGRAMGLPADLAENHDHYLHGTPPRS